MSIIFGREICGTLSTAESREWLITNGIGGYAAGTIAGILTRRYHGLLIAALKPPLGRTLMLTKLDETVRYLQHNYPLYANRWLGDIVDPVGYQQIEQFYMEGTIPVWRFACADALLEKRIWMQHGSNTTYIHYSLMRATQPVTLKAKALVNHRDHHSETQANRWHMDIHPASEGVCIEAFPDAARLCLQSNRGEITIAHDWYYGFDLTVERYRGLGDREDHLHAASVEATLTPGESLTIVASIDPNVNLDGKSALEQHQQYEKGLLQQWRSSVHQPSATPAWMQHLVLAADQFIVDRPLPNEENGKTIIAGYPWFGDWGRDTMISLPGLTTSTGRTEIARPILRTFARYVDQGMLPNLFPEAGETPQYNTVDATLWYFEAIRAYYDATQDDDLLRELFPILADIIDWHQRGTRFQIHLDSDGLLYAGAAGTQLTWMDAKVGDWVVTPRIGKPIEVNALWYNALMCLSQFAQRLGKPDSDYHRLAEQTRTGFQRYWNAATGYCFDVLDGPDGNDSTLRPNQIFAVSLPTVPVYDLPLLSSAQQRSVVDVCAQTLLTSYGLRSLSPTDLHYRGHYGGDQLQRDGAYHQGTVWGWLIGPFVQAHYRVYQDAAIAQSFLAPMADHLRAHCVGSLSEIFDGDAPITPRGAFAQAWSVAEVLRVWQLFTPRSQALAW
jgi:predicted glycogen debranching enzyme